MWFRRPWVWLCAALVAVLVIGIGWQFVADPEGPPAASDGSAVDCSQTETDSAAEAAEIAAACDLDVEVVSERTPWETSWVLPSGNGRLDVSMTPTRTDVNGAWEAIDASIVADEDAGVLRPAAPLFDLELNAGGQAGAGKPLGVMERDGRSMAISFPVPLPEPTIDGARLVYALDEGVRLISTVFADGSGFVPVVELDSPAAAARFEELLADAGGADRVAGSGVRFGVTLSEGLRLVGREGGSVDAVDADGQVVFTAPPPVMWDSAGGVEQLDDTGAPAAVDRLMQAAPGDRVARMGVVVDDASMTVSMDPAMAADPETAWPVHLDPGFSGKGAAEWVAVRTGAYTNTLYKWGDTSTTRLGEGDGRCDAYPLCPATWTQRLVWQYSGLSTIASLAGSDIVSAKFRVNGWYSATCNATRTELHAVAPISSATKWSSLSWSMDTLISYRDEYHSAECGNQGYREFDALKALRLVADNNLATITLGLKAMDESTINKGWKRFRADATISVEYNRAPATPSAMQTLVGSTDMKCATGTSRPVIATTTPTFSVIGTDPDDGNVHMVFRAYKADNTTIWSPALTAGKASGSRHSITVPSGVLANGQTYRWRARAQDPQGRQSVSDVLCEFTVDTTKPPAPTLDPVPSGTGVLAVYDDGVERGGVGRTGKFTIGRGTATDVVSFHYSFGSSAMTSTATPGTDGTVAVSYTPTSSGPVTLYAKSKDKAGNFSGTATYTFDVAAPTEDAIWTLDEDVDSTAEGSGDIGALRPLTIVGASRPAESGPLALFGSREGDQALVFDGIDDYAWTQSGPVVDTTESFAVSAHVWLDAADLDKGMAYTALAQDGVNRSGFFLSYRSSCTATGGDAGTGCWAFRMADGDGTTTMVGPDSSATVKPDQWVHLLAEYDAPEQTMRLWVCGAGTPASPALGEPVGPASASRTATPWAANGAFTVGRALYNATPTDWWPGKIDNIRVFSGEVVDESKIRRLCQGAEATDFVDAGDSALDPTVVED